MCAGPLAEVLLHGLWALVLVGWHSGSCRSRETAPLVLHSTEAGYQLLLCPQEKTETASGKGLLWLSFRRFLVILWRGHGGTVHECEERRQTSWRLECVAEVFLVTVDQEAVRKTRPRDQLMTFGDLPVMTCSSQLVDPIF